MKFASCTLAWVGVVMAASPAWGATMTAPLPDLVGTYEYAEWDSLSGLPPPASVRREMGLQFPFPAAGVETASLHLAGSAVNGLVRGDGVLAEPVEATAIGAFRLVLILGGEFYDLYMGETAALQGAFTLDLALTKHVDKAPYEPRVDAVASAMLLLGAYDPGRPPYVQGAGGGLSDGIIVVVPFRATVTEAYLVFEGAAIPEPAALALLAAGAAGAFARRRSSLRPLRQAKPQSLRRGRSV